MNPLNLKIGRMKTHYWTIDITPKELLLMSVSMPVLLIIIILFGIQEITHEL